MAKKKTSFSYKFFITDFILVGIAFFLMNYLKRDSFSLSLPYTKLLIAFYGLWLILSLLTSKFFLSGYKNYKKSLQLILKTNVFILYGLSFMVVIMGLAAFSRLHIFGSCALLTILETAAFSLYYIAGGKQYLTKLNGIHPREEPASRFSVYLLLQDFVLLTFAFYIIYYYKRGSFELLPEYGQILVLIYGLWLIAGLFTRKFEKAKYPNFYYAVSPYIKSVILMAATMSVLVFAFRLFFYSRLQIFGTFLLLSILEVIFFGVYFITYLRNGKKGDVETVQAVREVLQQEKLSLQHRNGRNHKDRMIQPVREKLQDRYLYYKKDLFKFIDHHINLNGIDHSETLVINTHTPFNIETIEDGSLDLFVNLHRVNDFRYINRYFLEVHKKLYSGSFFIGNADTIETHKKMFYKKLPRYFAEVLYPLNFIYVRVLPKLPGIKKFYFFLTRGKNRVISKAELLGRLYFCGFKVLEIKEIGFSLFYIAQKLKTPSFDLNPSYGPVIKLKRIGYNGDLVDIFKFRTMHPYSEYLQEYIYDKYKLQNNGKFRDDFRLTEWGRVFRRLWIDELPQIVNYLRGDLTLVGIRALSRHYFDLYPGDLKNLRIRFKPGLVPPYYADMPGSFEEIVESERRYLEQKQKNPITTDAKYLSKAVYNIVFKKARSR